MAIFNSYVSLSEGIPLRVWFLLSGRWWLASGWNGVPHFQTSPSIHFVFVLQSCLTIIIWFSVRVTWVVQTMFVGAFFRNTLLLTFLTFNRPSKKVQTLGFWVEMALFWHKVDETWFAWLFSLLARMYHEGWPVLESVHSNHGLLFLTDVYESLVIVGEWCWLPGIQWTEGFEILWTCLNHEFSRKKPIQNIQNQQPIAFWSTEAGVFFPTFLGA